MALGVKCSESDDSCIVYIDFFLYIQLQKWPINSFLQNSKINCHLLVEILRNLFWLVSEVWERFTIIKKFMVYFDKFMYSGVTFSEMVSC